MPTARNLQALASLMRDRLSRNDDLWSKGVTAEYTNHGGFKAAALLVKVRDTGRAQQCEILRVVIDVGKNEDTVGSKYAQHLVQRTRAIRASGRLWTTQCESTTSNEAAS